MNRAEALGTFGAKLVKFASYYKYNFTFKGDGLSVTIGGDATEIYRLSVNTGEIPISTLMDEGPVYIRENDKLVYNEYW